MDKGFLGETINISFVGFEVSILVAYLIITSIYQVVIHTLDSFPDLKRQVYLAAVKGKLSKLLLVSIMTTGIVVVTTCASIWNLLWLDYLSLGGFTVVILAFLLLIVTTISGLRKSPEDKK